MTLGSTLYVTNSIEAISFYCNAFNMKIGYNAKHEDGTYLHAELEKNNHSIFAVSESNDTEIAKYLLHAKQPITSLVINLDNNDELNHAYEILSKNGHVLRSLGSLPWSPCSADIVDKYGVCWYIYVSQHKPD